MVSVNSPKGFCIFLFCSVKYSLKMEGEGLVDPQNTLRAYATERNYLMVNTLTQSFSAAPCQSFATHQGAVAPSLGNADLYTLASYSVFIKCALLHNALLFSYLGRLDERRAATFS